MGKGVGIVFLLALAVAPLAAVPGNLQWTFVSSNTASTSWGESGSGVSYVAAVSTTSGFAPVSATGTTALDQLTSTYFNLIPNTTQYFKVKVSSDPDTLYAAAITTVTPLETPTEIFVDDVSTDSAVVSVYTPGAGFTGLGIDQSGTNIASGTVYAGWHVAGSSWSAKAIMDVARRGAAAAVVNGKIYVLGGRDLTDISNRNDFYDPLTNTWTNQASLPTRRNLAAAAVVGGKIYVIGGVDADYLTTNEMYDPETNTWSTKASMPTARAAAGAAVINGKIYVIGGVNTTNPRTENEMYDPQTNIWTSRAALPSRRESLAVVTAQGKIYAIGGIDGATFKTTNEEYDPDLNSWTTKTAMPAARSQIASAYHGGKIYVMGGWDANASANIKSTTFLYDPRFDVWTSRPDLLTGRRQSAGASAQGKIYIIGGLSFTSSPDPADNTEEHDPGTSQRFTGLVPGAAQSFKAKARNSQGAQTAETTAISSAAAVFAPSSISTGSLSAIAATSMTVSWLTNSNPAGTSYYTWLSSGVNSTSLGWDAFASTGFVNLIPNTTYFAYVKARNSNLVETSWTSLSSTVTLAADPVTVSSTFTLVSTSAVSFSWSVNANPLGTTFVTEISSYSNFSPLAASSLTVVSVATFTNLTPNTTYYFQVKARNHSGLDTLYTFLGSTVTRANTVIASTFTQVSTTTLAANWTANSNPLSTRYQVDLSTSANFSVIAQSSNTANTTALFSNLEINTTYHAQVQAINHQGAATNFTGLESSVTLANIPATLVSTFTTVQISSLSIVWSSNSNPTGTVFIAEISSYSNFSPLAASSLTVVSVATFTNLTPNTTYYFQVKARNHSGLNTLYANLGSTITKANIVTASAFSQVSTITLAANWVANSNPAGTVYQVELATSSDFSNLTGSSVTLAASALFQNLSVNTTYYAQVQASNAQGEKTIFASLGSTSTWATNPLTLVSTYSTVAVNELALHWGTNVNPSGTKYIADISSVSNFSLITASSTTAVSSAAFTNLIPNTTYYGRVKALSWAGSDTAYTLLGSTVTKANPVTALAFIQVSTNTIGAHWSASTNPLGTRFKVELATTTAFDTITQTSITLSTSALFLNLGVNTTYHAQVQVINHQGEATIFTALGSTATQANQPAPAPSTFTAVLQTSMTINWSSNNNSLGTLYILEVSSDSGFGPPLISSHTRSTFTILTDILANTTFYARVRARSHEHLETNNLDLGPVVTLPAVPVPQAFSNVTAGALRVNWGDGGNRPLTLYQVDLDDDPNFGSIDRTSTTINTYADFASLSANTSYYARAQSFNSVGAPTEFSYFASTPTLANAPITFASAFSAVQITSVSFVWNVNFNPAGTRFFLELSTSTGFSPLASSSLTVLNSSILNGLIANTTYHARVKAINHSGLETDYTVTRTTLTLAAPPSSLSSTYTMVGASSITFQWATNANPDGTLYISEISSGTDFFLLANSSATTTQTIVTYTDLLANTTYFARVRAINQAGTYTSFALLGSTVTKASPAGALPLSNVQTTQVQTNWTIGSNPPGTSFEARADDDPGFGSVDRTSITNTTFATISGLLFNTTYFFQVRPLNLAGEPAPFTSLGSTPTLAFQPVAISTLIPAFPSVYISSVPVLWSANSNPTGTIFIAEISTYSNFSTLAASSLTLVSVATFTNLTPNTTYYFQVKARNHSGMDTLYSNLGSTITRANPVTASAFSQVSTNTLAANWTSNSNPVGTSYLVEIAAGSDFGSIIASSTTLTTSALFKNLSVNTTYYAQVQAINAQEEKTIFVSLGSTSTFAANPLTHTSTYSAVGINELALQWGANINPSGTRYIADISSVSGFGLIAASSNTVISSAAFTGLIANTTYYGRVKALSWVGADTAYTLLGSTITKANPAGALDFSQVSSNTLAANWTSNSNPLGTSYRVELATSANFAGVLKSSVTFTTTALFKSLSVNNTYYSQVQAINAQGEKTIFVSLGSTSTFATSPLTLVSTYSAVGINELVLHWATNANPSGTKYIADISSVSGFGLIAASSNTVISSAAFTGLIANTTYYGRVKALSWVGADTAYTLLGSTITKANPAGALDYSEVSTGALAANWTSNSNPLGTSYRVDLATSSDFGALIGTSVTLTTSALFQNLSVNTTYYAQVQAINAQGEKTIFVSLGSTSTFANDPVSVVSTYSAVGINALVLQWGANANPSGTKYIADISSVPGFGLIVASSNTVISSAAFTGLIANTTYYGRVKALSWVGADTAYTLLGSTITKANPAGALDFSNISTNTLAANWSSNSNPVGTIYHVELSTNSDFAAIAATTVTLTTTALFKNLSVNTTYYSQVQAINAQGEATIFTQLGSTATLANPPKTLSTSFAVVERFALTIQWDANENPSGTLYTVELSTWPGFPFVYVTSHTFSTQIRLDNLLANRFHTARVKAKNRLGLETAYTFLGSTTTIENTPPQKPLGLNGIWENQFTLTWEKVAYDADGGKNKDLLGYDIYRSTSLSGPYTLVALMGANKTSWIDSDSFRYTIYYYKIQAIDSNQNLSEFSDPIVSTLEMKSEIASSDGGLSLVIPSHLLTKKGSGVDEALNITLERNTDQEKGRVLLDYTLKAVTLSGKTLDGYQFSSPIEFRFQIPVVGSSATIAAAQTIPYSEMVNTSVSLHNGAEWIRLDGKLDSSARTLTSMSRRTGTYALRQSLAATEFTILSIEPRKIITPAGQYPYNQFTIHFANPKDSQLTDGRIFNLDGAAVADFKTGSDDSSFYWDGRDYGGGIAPSGVYLYQIQIEGKTFNGTVVVAK